MRIAILALRDRSSVTCFISLNGSLIGISVPDVRGGVRDLAFYAEELVNAIKIASLSKTWAYIKPATDSHSDYPSEVIISNWQKDEEKIVIEVSGDEYSFDAQAFTGAIELLLQQ